MNTEKSTTVKNAEAKPDCAPMTCSAGLPTAESFLAGMAFLNAIARGMSDQWWQAIFYVLMSVVLVLLASKSKPNILAEPSAPETKL